MTYTMSRRTRIEQETRMTRTTTVHSRYAVGCEFCGYHDGFRSRTDAISYARRNKAACPGTTIFDIMARKGRPNIWDSDGRILGRRMS